VIPPLRRICEELPPPVLNNPFLTCNELTSEKKLLNNSQLQKGKFLFMVCLEFTTLEKEKKMLL